jgi:acyl carrier protein
MSRQTLPKGIINHCPKCRTRLRVRRSAEIGRVSCTQCGAILWFRTDSGLRNWIRTCRRPGTWFYDAQEVEAHSEQLIATIVGMTNLTAEQVRSKISDDIVFLDFLDSLDIVELAMELEDDFKKNGGSGLSETFGK